MARFMLREIYLNKIMIGDPKMKLTQLFGRSRSVDSVAQGSKGSNRQMTRCPSRLLLAIPLLAAMASANAIPITFTDVYDPVAGTGDLWFARDGGVSTHSFTHDINDSGYNAGSDVITGVSIALSFLDDGDSPSESVTFTFDGVGFGTVTLASGTTLDIRTFTNSTTPALSTSSLLDGLLTVKLDRGNGANNDFYFVGSTLTVTAERTLATAVPEPATVLLFGLGLLGLGWSLRRKS